MGEPQKAEAAAFESSHCEIGERNGPDPGLGFRTSETPVAGTVLDERATDLQGLVSKIHVSPAESCNFAESHSVQDPQNDESLEDISFYRLQELSHVRVVERRPPGSPVPRRIDRVS